MKKRIQISTEIYEQLSRMAKVKGVSIDEIANQLLTNFMKKGKS